MAIDYDGSVNGTNGTGTLSWTHTPVGTLRGVVVLVCQNAGITDEVTSVTYGGTGMTEVALSPLIHSTGAEDGVIYGYLLGASVPTGAQTVQVNVNATGSNKSASSWGIVGADDIVVADTSTLDSGGVANPSVNLTADKDARFWAIGGVHSGVASPGSITPGAAYTGTSNLDFGQQSWKAQRLTTPTDLTNGSNLTFNFTIASDEAGILAILLRQANEDAPPASFLTTLTMLGVGR